MQQPSTRLIPISKWPDHHHWPTVAGLRWMIFNKEENGFSRAFKKVGSRVLVDEAEFFSCVDEQNKPGG